MDICNTLGMRKHGTNLTLGPGSNCTAWKQLPSGGTRVWQAPPWGHVGRWNYSLTSCSGGRHAPRHVGCFMQARWERSLSQEGEEPECILCGNLRGNEIVSCVLPVSFLYNSHFEGRSPLVSSQYPFPPPAGFQLVSSTPRLRSTAPPQAPAGVPHVTPAHSRVGESGISEAARRVREGQAERRAPQLSPEHQRWVRDVGALPPAALGRCMPGRALCADRGWGHCRPDREHHRAPERDFSAHQQDRTDAVDAPAGHHSSTRWALAQPASCARSLARSPPARRSCPPCPWCAGGQGGPPSGKMAAGPSPAAPGARWPGWGCTPVGRGGRVSVAVSLFLSPYCPRQKCFIKVPRNP